MGDRTLRLCLIGLVLIDLVFVQLTEATRMSWLLVLYALTVLSPLLKPWREKLLYRSCWNLGVVGVFALLVHHATGDDLRYVLEDGLILAALSQVHLLNNLRSDQRPDLLFLNSFLIAIVTGYLSQDLAFAVAFAVYAPLLIVGLCLYGMAGVGELDARIARRVAADGLVRACALVVATLLVFALWPRDFNRKGILTGHLDLSSGGGDEVAFNDSLSLERGGRAGASDEIVMRVRLESGATRDVPTLWRGATLLATNGDAWWPFPDSGTGRGFFQGSPWRSEGGQLVRGQGQSSVAHVTVESLDGSSGRLFTPLSAERLEFEAGSAPGPVVARADGTLEYGEPGASHAPVRYSLSFGSLLTDQLGGRFARDSAEDLRPFLELPDSRRIRTAVDLASELALETSGRDQHELVAHFSDYLSTHHAYLPPGAEGAAGNLEEFLRGGAGHCEFFASALATMLRSRGVPCRVVTGYRASEWDGEGRVLTIRKRHAHAWVEVDDPFAGWYAVDPNPAPGLDAGPSALARLRAELGLAWEQLTAFDSERRAQLMAFVRGLPGRGLAAAQARPGRLLGAGVVLVLCAVALGLLRRRGSDPVVRNYERVVRRAGLARDAGETPRELLERAATLSLKPERLASLSAATEDHERLRYT